jgi:peroxiredoxin
LAGFGSIGDHADHTYLDRTGYVISIGEEAPSFVLERVDGESVDLSSLTATNDIVVLKFWSTWCPFCWIDLLELSKSYDSYRSWGVEVVTIALDSRDAVTAYLEERPMACPILLDTDEAVADQYRIQMLPTTIVIDRNRKVVKSIQGLALNLDQVLTELLGTVSAELH